MFRIIILYVGSPGKPTYIRQLQGLKHQLHTNYPLNVIKPMMDHLFLCTLFYKFRVCGNHRCWRPVAEQTHPKPPLSEPKPGQVRG